MAVNGDEEPLAEFKGTGELLHQLPHTLQELIDDGGHLFRVSDQVVASVEDVGAIRSEQYVCVTDDVKVMFQRRTCGRICVQMRSSLSR